MTDIKLIHKSSRYSDKIVSRMNTITRQQFEDYIRSVIFDCWKDAFAAGYSAALNAGPHKEDMGK
jgi:hypothetical protein